MLMDANHCPGAAIILFTIPNSLKSVSGCTNIDSKADVHYLHTGDFRFIDSMVFDSEFLRPFGFRRRRLDQGLKSTPASLNKNNSMAPIGKGDRTKKLDAIFLDTTYCGMASAIGIYFDASIRLTK